MFDKLIIDEHTFPISLVADENAAVECLRANQIEQELAIVLSRVDLVIFAGQTLVVSTLAQPGLFAGSVVVNGGLKQAVLKQRNETRLHFGFGVVQFTLDRVFSQQKTSVDLFVYLVDRKVKPVIGPQERPRDRMATSNVRELSKVDIPNAVRKVFDLFPAEDDSKTTGNAERTIAVIEDGQILTFLNGVELRAPPFRERIKIDIESTPLADNPKDRNRPIEQLRNLVVGTKECYFAYRIQIPEPPVHRARNR